MSRLLLRWFCGLSLLALGLLALYPVLERWQARREVRAELWRTRAALGRPGARPLRLSLGPSPSLLPREPALHCWGNIGGCGAGGGSSSGAAGAKWVGRGVTGGLVDLQLLATQSVSHGNLFSTFNTRIGTGILTKWNFGLNVPLLYKVGQVDVLGQSKDAHIAGFGDVSLELTRKLGITNASMLTLILNAPSGAHDAVRQGIVLPQHLQLGSGVLGATLQFEHTMDRDWGLMILGGNASYNGWENGIGDWRAPSATAYGHLGYIWGPFVSAVGLNLFGKYAHDRERYEDRPGDQDPLLMASPSLSLEWASDYLALLLYASTSFSYNGYESVAVTLGVSTSVF